MNKSPFGYRMLYSSVFAPATSKDAPDGTIVLQRDYLTLPKDSKCGVPGIFQLPVDDKSLESPSYNLVTKGLSFSGHDIVRCIVTPASDITIVPVDLKDYNCSTEPRIQIGKTKYILQSYKENSSYMKTGYLANMKLGLILRSVRDLTQRFQIDGAVLLDPGLQLRLPHAGRPVCLLGMDFITKYPYLFYVPRPDASGAIDFMIARDPLASRIYSVCEQFYKTVIVHVDGYHNPGTGNIGCGIFFKSGSVFNMLSGVSKYDKAGNKHVTKLKERGILMAIIKALHVVRAFPVGRDFRGVIIRSTDPAIARLMAVTQVTMRNVFTDSRRDGEDGFDPMEGGYYYPTANRDLMLYFCHTFLQSELGFKVTFEDSKNCGEALAASLLAAAGSHMEEFCMAKQRNGLSSRNLSLSPQTQCRETNKAMCPGITSLEDCVGLEEDPIYISLGLDGYFHTQQKTVHAAMEAADAAGLSHEVDAALKSNGVSSDRKHTASLDGVSDRRKSLEKDLSASTHTKQRLQNGCQKGLKPLRDEPYEDVRVCTDDCSTAPPTYTKKQELVEPCYEVQRQVNGGTHTKAEVIHPELTKMEERIHTEVRVRIVKAKAEGLRRYESAEKQMAVQVARINQEGLEKHGKINEEINAKLAATSAEFFKKRNLVVTETRTKIKEIEAEVPRKLEMLRWKFSTDKGGKKKPGMLRAGYISNKTKTCPLGYTSSPGSSEA